MATVPRLTAPSVAPTAAPDFREQNPVNADVLNISARQTQQPGAALVGLGGQMENVRLQMLEQANALRVDDALNQATEQALRLQHDPKEGYTTQKGYDALNRASGQPLADEYTGKLDAEFSKIAGTLGNDRQRQMFSMRANNIRTQFLGSALQYESRENQDYNLSVREGTVKNAANALVLNYTDPKNVEMQETRIKASILGGVDPDTGVFVPGAAQMQGKSATWAQEKAAEAVSGAHLGAIKSALESGNISGAMAYRKQYGNRLTAADMLQIDGTLQKNNDMMTGAAVAREVVTSTQSIVQPTDMNRLTNIIMQAESGGRDTNAAGGILTSPKGAQGRMQVMPGTNKDPGFGVRPAQDDGPEERARVGRDYLAAMVKRYDGDVAKAAAAYNWGPGAVDKAVKEAEQNAGRGEAVSPDAWLASAPAETRAYVAKVTKAMGDPRAGVAARPTLLDMQNAARARLGPNASPLAVKTAIDGVEQQFTAQTKAIDQRKDELVAKGYEALTQNGGRFTELPASLRAQLMRDAPEKVDELMNFGNRMAKGDDVTDDRLYLRLTMNPQTMAQMSDAQFYALRGGLSQSDFQYFSKQRADIRAGKSQNQAGDLNTGAVSRFADTRLRGLGIDPTPKDGSADAQRVGAIRRFIDSSLLDAQRQTGKKFTDAEVQQHVDGLFAQNVQFRSSFLGIPTGTSSRQLLSMRPGDVPSADADRIRKAFKAQGNDNPTDADILGAYFAGRAGQPPAGTRGGATGTF